MNWKDLFFGYWHKHNCTNKPRNWTDSKKQGLFYAISLAYSLLMCRIGIGTQRLVYDLSSMEDQWKPTETPAHTEKQQYPM